MAKKLQKGTPAMRRKMAALRAMRKKSPRKIKVRKNPVHLHQFVAHEQDAVHVVNYVLAALRTAKGQGGSKAYKAQLQGIIDKASGAIHKIKAKPNPRGSEYSANRALSNEAEAKKLYETFHGKDPAKAVRVALKESRVVVKLGSLQGVIYHDGVARYVHIFKGTSRPTLAVSPDGKQLYVLGGAYRVGANGIKDT